MHWGQRVAVPKFPHPLDLSTIGKRVWMHPSGKDDEMYNFQVSDMTCAHCVAPVERAIKSVDGAAKVDIDLNAFAIKIESDKAVESFAKATRMQAAPVSCWADAAVRDTQGRRSSGSPCYSASPKGARRSLPSVRFPDAGPQ